MPRADGSASRSGPGGQARQRRTQQVLLRLRPELAALLAAAAARYGSRSAALAAALAALETQEAAGGRPA